ncbi:phospholipid scramblase 2-like [Antedon mediterranea]|uniref:phospholipid scramblase 2-like n=1 Tax=Antedon mediterranea TaxID=105859 RepID=UPI003AF9FFEE
MSENTTGTGTAPDAGPAPGTDPVPGSVPPQGQPQPGYGPPQQGYPGVPPGYPQPGHPQPGHPQPGYGYGPAQPGYAAPPPGYQGQPGVVGVQPGAVSAPWMAKPETVPGCPPGLEYLTQVDQVLVHQVVELLEAFTNWETPNRYQIKNSLGQQVYYAFEESDVCQRQCCGPSRGFIMHIVDNTNQEVMRVSREFKCCAGCCWCADSDCCGLEVVVEAPVGQVIGYVRQRGSFWKASYDIMNAEKETVLTILGPCCICQGICCTWDQEFKVFSTNGIDEIGKVSKQWSGLVKEMYTNADNFGVEFAMDLDVKVKATLVGAVFLIDFMFFEQKQNNNNHH